MDISARVSLGIFSADTKLPLACYPFLRRTLEQPLPKVYPQGSFLLSNRPTAGSRQGKPTLSPRHLSSQRQYQGKDSLIAALEEKYVRSEAEETLHDSSSSERLEAQGLPQQPIHMLGSLVSPHLVQAKVCLSPSKPRLMQVL